MRSTTIQIEGKPFTFEDEFDDITYETIGPISEQDAKELLETTKRLFDICGMRFSLAFGTLLGAVREHGIIKGDDDVDIFVDSEEELRKNLPFLYDNGLKLCRIYEHALYSFRLNDRSFIDVYIHSPLEDAFWGKWYDMIACEVVPKKYVSGFVTMEFLGGEYFVPIKPERMLKCWYGSTWKVPISNAHNCKNFTLYEWWMDNKYKRFVKRHFSSCYGVLRSFFRKLLS